MYCYFRKKCSEIIMINVNHVLFSKAKALNTSSK